MENMLTGGLGVPICKLCANCYWHLWFSFYNSRELVHCMIVVLRAVDQALNMGWKYRHPLPPAPHLELPSFLFSPWNWKRDTAVGSVCLYQHDNRLEPWFHTITLMLAHTGIIFRPKCQGQGQGRRCIECGLAWVAAA